MNPDYSIIITAKSRESCEECVKSIRDNTGGSFEIIVLTPCFGDLLFIKRLFSNVYYINNDGASYADSLNMGLKYARSDSVVLMHDDVYTHVTKEDWLHDLDSAMEEKEKSSCIGPIATSARSLQNQLVPVAVRKLLSAKIDGFCLFTNKGIIDLVGGFNDYPPDLCITDWILRAARFNLFPFIDTGVFMDHSQKNRYFDKKWIDSALKLSEIHGDKYSFLEYQMNVELRR